MLFAFQSHYGIMTNMIITNTAFIIFVNIIIIITTITIIIIVVIINRLPLEKQILYKCPDLKYILLFGPQLEKYKVGEQFDFLSFPCAASWDDDNVMYQYTRK